MKYDWQNMCTYYTNIERKQSKEEVEKKTNEKKLLILHKLFGRFRKVPGVCVCVDGAAKTVFHGTYLRFLWQQY